MYKTSQRVLHFKKSLLYGYISKKACCMGPQAVKWFNRKDSLILMRGLLPKINIDATEIEGWTYFQFSIIARSLKRKLWHLIFNFLMYLHNLLFHILLHQVPHWSWFFTCSCWAVTQAVSPVLIHWNIHCVWSLWFERTSNNWSFGKSQS